MKDTFYELSDAVFPIIFIAIFLFVLAFMIYRIFLTLNPRARGKHMARQLKSVEEMQKSAKNTIENIAKNATEIENDILTVNKENLENISEKSASIDAIGLKVKAQAVTEGIRDGVAKDQKDFMYCKSCGKKIGAESKFCQYCGSKIGKYK